MVGDDAAGRQHRPPVVATAWPPATLATKLPPLFAITVPPLLAISSALPPSASEAPLCDKM